MSGLEEERTPGLTDAAIQDPEPESLLEQLAAKHRQLADTKECYIPVPGYDKEPPLLLVCYRLIEGNEVARMGEKIKRETRNQWDRQVKIAVDTFIMTCKGFYVDAGDGDVKPLTFKGEHIVRFDGDLAEALGFVNELPEEFTARSVVFALFNNNDAAIAQHSFYLNRWFSDTSINIQDEIAGNW